MNLGHQCALCIYRVVKLPKDFLITQWKWLLRPNVPIAVHGQESREGCVPWGKHSWWRPLPWEMGCSGCGGWEDLQFAVYMLETQEGQCYNPTRVWKPESQGLDIWQQERWISQLKKREREREFAFPSPWAINRLNDTHPHWWGESYTQSTDSDPHLFQQHPHRCTQK